MPQRNKSGLFWIPFTVHQCVFMWVWQKWLGFPSQCSHSSDDCSFLRRCILRFPLSMFFFQTTSNLALAIKSPWLYAGVTRLSDRLQWILANVTFFSKSGSLNVKRNLRTCSERNRSILLASMARPRNSSTSSSGFILSCIFLRMSQKGSVRGQDSFPLHHTLSADCITSWRLMAFCLWQLQAEKWITNWDENDVNSRAHHQSWVHQWKKLSCLPLFCTTVIFFHALQSFFHPSFSKTSQ